MKGRAVHEGLYMANTCPYNFLCCFSSRLTECFTHKASQEGLCGVANSRAVPMVHGQGQLSEPGSLVEEQTTHVVSATGLFTN